ncbi:ATP-binding protein [Sandaracinus amylolyticus]|uniref:PAS domain-containing sensor histidine kinase n=1 Tax=Sandaracinus amylolyticus TaxID=927083 RepID=UPI001F3C4BA3|nr:ATP-binding protein [Sandaracinus amylolyticus]UJR80037.1 Sensory box histidine kinase [Sandaracinus amylolyticus]
MRSSEATRTSRWDPVARAAGVVALGAGVLGAVGHALDVRVLLQPFDLGPAPSIAAVACLLLLGASSLAMLGSPRARMAAGFGGVGLACVGALATFRALDALLEGDRAAIASPYVGLALGTAACFAAQGASITLFAARRRARAAVAIASTLTLGLALASMLAFSMSVPMLQRYGVEMPLLVALALAAHGGGLLAWAWYSDVHEHDLPMPAWSPLVAAISAGIIFIVFTIAIEGDAAILQVVLVLGAAGKLGQAVHGQLRQRRADVAARHAAQDAQVRAEERSAEAIAQRRQLERVLDLAPVPLVLVDPAQARVTFANEAADRLAAGRFTRDGKSTIVCEDLRGRPLPDSDSPMSRVARGERLEGVPLTATTAAGRRDLLVHGALLPAAQAEPSVAVLALQDVTQVRRAEEVTTRLGRIVDDAPIEVYAFDASSLVLVQENASALRNLGYRSDELRGAKITELWREPSGAALEALLEPLRTGERDHVVLETEHVRKDGTTYPVEARIRLSRTETPPVFLALVENITARKRTEEERARLLSLERHAREEADAARERLAFIADASRALVDPEDLESTLRAAARAALPRLASWSVLHLVAGDGSVRRASVAATIEASAAAIARDVPRIAPESSLARALAEGETSIALDVGPERMRELLGLSSDAGLDAARALGVRACATIGLRARGRTIGALSLIESGEPSKWRKDTEIALAQDYATRAALAIDDAQLHEDAKAALRARDDFLVVASHDLQMPLSLLKMQVESMQRSTLRPGGLAPDRLARALEAVHRLATKLAVVVEDLVDPSRLTRDRIGLAIEQVDLAGLVCTVVARFADRFERAGSRVALSAPVAIPGEWDAFRLEQVVGNLLSNAIKYGSGKPIEVAVEADGDVARLRVRDHGTGITEDRRARIFSLEARSVPTRQYGGLGLGLYLVRRIVDALGGHIEVESDPGVGTTFTVTLPRRAASRHDQESAA